MRRITSGASVVSGEESSAGFPETSHPLSQRLAGPDFALSISRPTAGRSTREHLAHHSPWRAVEAFCSIPGSVSNRAQRAFTAFSGKSHMLGAALVTNRASSLRRGTISRVSDHHILRLWAPWLPPYCRPGFLRRRLLARSRRFCGRKRNAVRPLARDSRWICEVLMTC